jgi:hypothetical protein
MFTQKCGSVYFLNIIIPIFLLVSLLLCYLLTWTMSKQERTVTNIIVLRRTLTNYYTEHKKIPKKLSELGESEREIDGWGNKINYKFDQKIITLFSYGKGNTEGGQGEEADIKGVFDIDSSIIDWISWTDHMSNPGITQQHSSE